MNGLRITEHVIVGLTSMVAFVTTIIIFFCKKRSERPSFVVIQTIAIDISCICFITYFLLLYYAEHYVYLTNAIAIVADFFLYGHDWIFTE